MGKSSKKFKTPQKETQTENIIKNERINLIRKQYDAFLEEDKKRRERNEYILGKLDKMRSSMTLVPISTKVNYHLGTNPYDLGVRPDNVLRKVSVYDNYRSHLDRQQMASNINNQLDESTILKEISKNYILIPKRRTIAEDDYIYHKEAVHDNDWKSKYDILYDLKKQEKEGHSDALFQQNNENYVGAEEPQDTELVNCDKQFSHFNQFVKEVPSKDVQPTGKNMLDMISGKQVNKESAENMKEKKMSLNTIITPNTSLEIDATRIKNPIINNLNQSQKYVTEKEKYNSDVNEKNENYLMENINNLEINKGNVNNQTGNQENVCLINDMKPTVEISKNSSGFDNNSMKKSSSKSSQEHITKEFSETNDVLKQSPTKEKDTNKAQVSTSRERVKLYEDIANPESQILKQSNDNENKNYYVTQSNVPFAPETPTERVENKYDIDNSPEGRMESNENNYDTTQDYQATENNIPTVLEGTEQVVDVNHDTEINAFEAEQKEMFYSEQTGGDAYDYQGDANTEEYNDEAYQQNDQYAYYEGVQQEQEYANINEHEESTERYDLHYNQQYEGTYENQQPINYENTNAYDEQQYQEGNYEEHQQFENIVNYENQQDNANLYQPENVSNENDMQGNILVPQENQIYDEQMYSEVQETQEHIEQQLVTEEGGFIESVPISELQNENELNMDTLNSTTTLADPLPDPKLS